MRKIKGSSLIDYVLPTALIGLVAGLGLYAITKDNLLLNFFTASGNMNINMEKNSASIGSIKEEKKLFKPGSFGGTPESPKSNCVNNKCTIDFGDYIIEGVPEEFGNVASGSRGGELTKTYALILNQLAEQEIKGLPPDTTQPLLKQLALEAYKMSLIETRLDQKLQLINDYQKNLIQETGNDYNKIIDNIKSTDINNLTAKDTQSLILKLSCLYKGGILSQDQLKGNVIILASIAKSKENNEPLTQWQEKYLYDITNNTNESKETFKNYLSNLSEEEKNVIFNTDNPLYAAATGTIDLHLKAIQSDTPSDIYPGYKFNTLMQSVETSDLPENLKQIVKTIGTQVTLIGNSINTSESTEENINYIATEIPPDAGVNTKVASQFLYNLK